MTDNSYIADIINAIMHGKPYHVIPERYKDVCEHLHINNIRFTSELHVTKDKWRFKYYIIKGEEK